MVVYPIPWEAGMQSLGLTVFLCLFMASTALADVPARLEYQGYLTDAVGTPIDCQGCNTPFAFKFSLYGDAVAGEVLWSETHTGLDIVNGLFRVELGIYDALDAELLAGERWLEIQVNGQDPLVPRQSVISVPYALRAGIAERAIESENAVSLGGQSAESYLQTAELADTLNTLGYLPGDSDTLSSLLCAADQIARWDGTGWTCSTDQLRSDGDIVQVISDAGYIAGAHTVDTTLSEAEVELFITNEAINLFEGATVDGRTISTGAHAVNTTLTDAEVETSVESSTTLNLHPATTMDGVPISTGAHTVNTNLTNAEVETSVESSATLNLHVATTIGGQAISTGAHSLNTDTQLTEEAVVDYITNSPIDLAPGSTIGGSPTEVIPAGAVMFFNLNTCPSGWTQLTAAQGRFVVGLHTGGSLANTVGTALNNLENRPIGQHGHGVTDPGHVHPAPKVYTASGGTTTAVKTLAGEWSTVSHTVTGITVDDGGTVAGTNAPYIQLLVCEKN